MKITKSTLAVALLLAGMVTLKPLGLAADKPADKPDAAKPDAPRRERREQARDRIEQMAKELNLSDDQKTKLKPVFQHEAEKMKALRDDTSLSREQRREKLKAIRDDFVGKVKEVLTKEQFEKWEKLREQRPQRPPRRPSDSK
jgi:Spy/CpxP family protein refolding chaperone